MTLSMQTWQEAISCKAQLLHQQIASMQRLVADAGGDDRTLQESCAPYYRLLNCIYEEDLPLARALDTSDLLLHLEGPGVQTTHPRLALVSGVLGDIRKQVGGMIRVLAGVLDEHVAIPKEIDLGLTSLATGSLYLGFSLPEPGHGQKFVSDDPLVAASREALRTVNTITTHLNATDAYEQIAHDFPDPMLRDAGLAAVNRLAPSGRRGIESIGLTIKSSTAPHWSVLTRETRRQIQTWLEKPILGREQVAFTGVVREIDLDARRIDLRQISERQAGSMRCIYPADYDAAAKNWLDMRLRVSGRVETYQGKPRLMQVDEIQVC
jgi:hypothetical protein